MWGVQTGRMLHEWTEYPSTYPFSQISFSPDNKYLSVRIAEYKDNQTTRSDITLDILSSEVVDKKVIPEDTDGFSSGILSPDGLFAVKSTSQAIHIIDPSTQAIRYTFERPENDYGIIRNWAISPEGNLMVRYYRTGSSEPVSIIEMWGVSINTPPALLWSAEAGSIYMEEGQNFGYPNYAFSPDGKLLAASDKDNLVRVWDAGDGKLLTQMERGSKIYFSPDGASLLLIDNRGSASVWNISAENTISLTAEIEGFGSYNMQRSNFFSGDSLVTISNQKISTWDVARAKKVNIPITTQYLKNIKPGVITVSAGNILATTQDRGKISLFDAATGALIKNLSQGDDENNPSYNTIAISHDEKTVVSSGYRSTVGKFIDIWDVPSGSIRKEITDPSIYIMQFIFSSDDRLIVGISSPGSISKGVELAIWDVKTGDLLRYYSNLGNRIDLNPNGVTLASVEDDDKFNLLDLNNGKLIWQGQTDGNIRDLVFSPDGHILAVLTDKAVEFWDTDAQEKLGEFSIEAQDIFFSSDGKYIAAGYEDGIYHYIGTQELK